MAPEAALLDRFYAAFAARDHRGMVACYHPEVHFRDEVFDLRGPAASAMWHWLCERGGGLVVTHEVARADADAATARWTADYAFGPKRRPVHNEVEAAFTFRDGLILTHRDRFDFRPWARQALGPVGLVFGGTGWLRRRVTAQANRGLARFIEAHPAYRTG